MDQIPVNALIEVETTDKQESTVEDLPPGMLDRVGGGVVAFEL